MVHSNFGDCTVCEFENWQEDSLSKIDRFYLSLNKRNLLRGIKRGIGKCIKEDRLVSWFKTSEGSAPPTGQRFSPYDNDWASMSRWVPPRSVKKSSFMSAGPAVVVVIVSLSRIIWSSDSGSSSMRLQLMEHLLHFASCDFAMNGQRRKSWGRNPM